MFEFLFHYTPTVFARGQLVLLGSWPVWVLALLIMAVSVGIGWAIRSRLGEAAAGIRGWRPAIIWLLQSALAAVILLLLWKPALLVSELKPQQNIIAILVDDSRSMAITEDGSRRRDQAVEALQGGVLAGLQEKFQARLYRMGDHLERIRAPEQLSAEFPATRIGESLKQLASEFSGLPLGAVLLVSDGADNSGGIDLETIAELRSRRVPVHTVGVGRLQPVRDLEIADVQLGARTLADARLAPQVTFQQRGYAGGKAKLSVREGGKVLASREVTLAADGTLQTESIVFNAGAAGAKALQFSLDLLDGEENQRNNSTTRLLNVEAAKPRILYVEGEPRWEYKFIRRAVEDDRSIQLVTMLRTTQNKIYRQNVSGPKDLEEGFPARVEELFSYQGLILGSVELGYFTTSQQELIRQFVDRRGGGLLALGGRSALAEGGYGRSALAELLPVTLPDRKETFYREPATVELTQVGAESLICRLIEDPVRNAERWKKLPYLMSYQEIGVPKPGAAVLAELSAGGRRMPLLVTQNYGRGRTAILATAGTWRWQMSQPLEDQTHEMFWQQLLRWLVSDTPGHVAVSTPHQMLFDDGRLHVTAEVRDKNYLPMPDARVDARILGPQGTAAQIEMTPDPATPGLFHAEWIADSSGSYLTEVSARRGEEEVGRDVLTFQRQDGVAEDFRTWQNRELLTKLSEQTGGRYWQPTELGKLASEISYSEAGITVRQAKELWHMPAVFLLILVLRFTEWLLRRRWGVV